MSERDEPQPLGWQGSQTDFEVTGKPGEAYEATAWDEDVCVGKFRTRSRLVLWVRLWIWHAHFNSRKGPLRWI